MIKKILKISILVVLSTFLSIRGSTDFEQENRIPSIQTQALSQAAGQNLALIPDFGKIPLYFIPNEGQVDEKALFYAKTSSYTLWLTEEGLVFDSTRRFKKESPESTRQNPGGKNDPEDVKHDRDVSRLVFLKGNRSPEVVPVDLTEHKVNYFIGNDESKWRSNIQTSRAVLYKELYPDIDFKVYGMERQIEYDFVVKPGGEVSDISFEYKHIEETRIDREGNLVIKAKFGEIMHARPVCYQVIDGERVEVQAEFMKRKGRDNNYGFKVKAYNRNYELIIDPLVLVYSTYLGGSDGDSGWSIAVDSEGAAYVTGETWSTDFPTRNPIQGSFGGGDYDAFIAKLNASGSALIYSTYLGGSDSEAGWGGGGIAVDSEGAAYVIGRTFSADFPTQNPVQGSNAGLDDVFVVKISASGSALIYSTYLGGSSADYGHGIAVDSEGSAYVTGETSSVDFPTQNPFQGSNAGGNSVFLIERWDAFITKLNSSGNAIIYSTYLGGSREDEGWRITVDSEGAAYVTGETSSVNFPTKNPFQEDLRGTHDAFITKVNTSGSDLIYSTYLGGSSADPCHSIAVDLEGAAYVTGWTSSFNFPTRNPIQANNEGDGDIFIVKLNASGSALIYSTYLGGSSEDQGHGMAMDSEGAVYVTGVTSSFNFPTKNPLQGSYGGGDRDAFVAKLHFSPSLIASLTITAGSGGTTEPSPGTYQYDEGTEVTVRAIPHTGYTFGGWSGAASGTTNPITMTMDSDKSITANFTKVPSGDDGGGSGGGCFVATACYGTPMAEEVKTLSAFRDRHLITNPLGRAIAKFYKTHSPRVADFIRDKEELKSIIRACLKPVVWIISEFL